MRFLRLALLVSSGIGSFTLRAEEQRPNVVIFFADDQGTLDVNCFGSDDLITPNMDALANRGVRFTQAYAHAVCCPARAALVTGRHPQRSNANSWTQSQTYATGKGRNLAIEETTIAEAFSEAGYATAIFGKWHIGAHPDHGPTKQGFDEFFGMRGGFIDNYSHFYLHREGFHDLFEGPREVFHRGVYFPDLIVDRAVSFIDRHVRDPFLLYVPLNLPHYPEQAVGAYAKAYAELEEPRRTYAKVVSTTDHYLGRIMQALQKNKLTDTTLVLFTSDNGHSEEDYQIVVDNHLSGMLKGDNYGANAGGGNTGKWRGAKGSFLEGGIRVPAILAGSPRIPAGEVRNQAVTVMDWMPTLLDLAGVETHGVEFDGKSLVGILADGTEGEVHTALHWQWQNGWAVREGDWKLISRGILGLGLEKLPPLMLTNLADETPEVTNHATTHPDVVEHLQSLHDTWANDVFAKYGP